MADRVGGAGLLLTVLVAAAEGKAARRRRPWVAAALEAVVSLAAQAVEGDALLVGRALDGAEVGAAALWRGARRWPFPWFTAEHELAPIAGRAAMGGAARRSLASRLVQAVAAPSRVLRRGVGAVVVPRVRGGSVGRARVLDAGVGAAGGLAQPRDALLTCQAIVWAEAGDLAAFGDGASARRTRQGDGAIGAGRAGQDQAEP